MCVEAWFESSRSLHEVLNFSCMCNLRSMRLDPKNNAIVTGLIRNWYGWKYWKLALGFRETEWIKA